MRIVKRIAIGLLVLFILGLGCVYGGGCWYFQHHFLPGTKIAGFDVSFSTVSETEKLLNDEILSYALAVDTRNGGREKLTAEQVGMSYNSTGEVRDFLKNQSYLLWFIPSNVEHSLVGGFKISQEKLDEAVRNLKCAQNMEAPVDARILKVNDKYQVIQEVNGTQLDLDKAKGLIETALKRGDVSVSLEECYKNPTIKQDDPELKQNCDSLNKMQQTIITYDFGDRSEFIDKDVVEKWIEDYQLSRDKVHLFVKELSEKYDTCGKERRFVTYDDRKITLAGGDYGWKIDVEKETEELYKLLMEGTVGVRKPIYFSTALKRERNDIGYSYLEIDVPSSKLVLYIEGKPVVEENIQLHGELPGGCNLLVSKNEGVAENILTVSGGFKIYGISTEKEVEMKLSGNSQMPSFGAYGILSENIWKKIQEAVPEGCPVIIY